jgi:hypothetical protein
MNPRPTSRESEGEVTPKRFAETTPPTYPGSDYNFMLQGVFEIQKSMGRLEHAVETLQEMQKTQGEKLDSVAGDVHTGKVALRVIGVLVVGLGGFLAWLLSRAWDVILKSYIPGH